MTQVGNELSERLDFMKFDDKARSHLRALSPLLMAHMKDALDAFYDKVRQTPGINRFFKNEGHIQSAHTRQFTHWEALASARFDGDYQKAVLTVGRTHARIGLEPRWYIGGYALVAEHLVKSIINDREGTLYKRLRSNPDTLGDVIATLMKAIFLDMDLAISTYLDALADERRKAEEARAISTQKQTDAMVALTAALSQLAGGNLTTRLDDNLAAEFDEMRGDFNGAMGKLHDVVSSVLTSMRAIENGNRELAQASDDLSRRTEQQAAALEETTAALAEITLGVGTTTDGVAHALRVASTATKDAEHTSEIVGRSKVAMTEIQDATAQIGNITDVIDEIAFQTNLLALNAGVEAARAGESGRGFAVVATEVRSLAQRASQSAKDIKSLIDHATTAVADGAELVTSTEDALNRFVTQVQEITTIISSIAGTAQEQRNGLSEVNHAVSDLDRATQQNAAMVEQSTAATQTLSNETTELARQLGFFVTNNVEAAPVLSMPRKLDRPARAPMAPPAPAREKRVVNGRPTPAPASRETSHETGWTEF